MKRKKYFARLAVEVTELQYYFLVEESTRLTKKERKWISLSEILRRLVSAYYEGGK